MKAPMKESLAALTLFILINVSFASDKQEINCFNNENYLSFLDLFDSLAQGKASDKKSMLICEVESGNPFAAILLAENYTVFKVNTIDLYSRVKKQAEEGEDRSLAILGISYIDPKLEILVDGRKPELMRWYSSGDPYNYEEAAKFYHQYYFIPDENGYLKAKAYAYLYYANASGSHIAKSYIDKLVLKMDEAEIILATKTIEKMKLINKPVVPRRAD